jgi:hypothetical protein
MVFNGVRQSTPIEKSKQANPAPRQAKPSKQGKAPSKRQANPAPRQGKPKTISKALPQCKALKKQNKPLRASQKQKSP